MKKFLLTLLACLCISVTWADVPFRNHRYDSYKVMAPAEGSILFIGNSITDMHCWHEVFKTSTGEALPIVNRGNSGTVSIEQSDNLESYLVNKPKKVFMMIGTNDIAVNVTPDQLLVNVNSIVKRIHMRYADVKVYIYSILNNNTSNRRREDWLKANELFQEYAAENENVTYVDLYEKLSAVATDNKWSYDHLHLTAGAYRVWCESICQYLQEGEEYTVSTVYPENTLDVQQNGGANGSHGMRATYFSMMPISNDDVLVFGDEMVKNGEWNELMGNNNVKNRGTGWGYGGDIATTTAMVNATYANTGVEKKDAKAIFLYTGTANCNGNTDMETVKADYKALVDLIAQKSPSSIVYLMSLCPINNAATNTSRISVLNDYAKSLADENAEDKIKYVDIYSALVADGVANQRYFYPNNYLGGLGYVKVAQLMKDALIADFPSDTYNVITEEKAQEQHNKLGMRNKMSQAMAKMLSIEWGNGVGQYSTTAQAQVEAKVKEASDLLASSEEVSEEKVNEFVNETKEIATKSLIYPTASTDGQEVWYQISSLRTGAKLFTAEGASAGVQGTEAKAKYAHSMWKFVERGDKTYDIINRKYGCYLSPAAAFNTQIQTTETQPAAGWTISYGDNMGYFIISSGEAQLNQTGDAQKFMIYNWSNPNGKGQDRADAGCQLDINVAPEPEEEPQAAETITYTVDKENGDLYRGTQPNQSFNNMWKSKQEPQLQLDCGTINNINWSGNNVQLFSGSSGSATYTLSAPEGYVIEEYSFTIVNGGHADAITITMDNGTPYTTSQEEQTISATGKKLRTLSFTQKGANKGVIFKNFTVKVKKDNSTVSGPEISTEDNVHWYYITSASTKDYCRDKVMYYDRGNGKIRFGNKAFSSEYIWSFWEKDGKLAIKNYQGEYMATPPTGTGNATTFGVVQEPNYNFVVKAAYGAYIIKDEGVELHAQNDGGVIVRWAAEAGGASLWRFEEADITNANATVGSTLVEQGKVTTGIGNKDQGIIRSTIRISGLNGSCHLKSIQGMFVGQDPKDISNVKIYFAKNSRELYVDKTNSMPWREQNAELCVEGTVNENRRFDIELNKDLTPGEHYLWIAYDIAETAQEGHTVDARIFSYVIDGDTLKEDSRTGHPANAATIFLSESAALMPSDLGSMCYRIPSITVTKEGSRLVIITDDRKNHGADLPSHCYLVAQYSDDLGKTWTRPQTVAGTAELGGNYGHGDASIVTNRDNGDIIGIMTSSGTYGHGFFQGTAQEPPRWKTIVSHDNGETWETPVDHTDNLYGANCSNPKTKTWKSGFSGSGAALQKRDGTLVSSFVNRQADNSQHFYFFMSKDGGNNWYVSGTSGTSGADEPKTLERNNGDLAISVRHGGYNYYNVTSDEGKTWKYPSQTQFTTGISGNACDGEYMVWCSTVEGNDWDIAFQTLPNSSSRENVSIALSTDEGHSFGKPKTICPRGSAYSAAVVLPDGTLGIYYEENGLSTGGYTMRFVRCSLDWASSGKYKFTQENPFRPIKSTATGIEDVMGGDNENTDNTIYDLQGRRVQNPTQAGVYIQKGKKVLLGK